VGNSSAQPTIKTERLTLRPYMMADAPAVQRIVSDRELASTTLSIPHPYPEDGAVEWLKSIEPNWSNGSGAVYAITLTSTGELVGSIDLRIKPEHRHAEIGYIIAREYWGNGYVTEAAMAMLRLGFETLNLNRIYAHHMTHNPASGRVMRKIGMRYEGTMRQHIIKWGEVRDIAFYGITREQWNDNA
jgi:RimJ/RimL family protein N-acetyltransferase